MLQMKTTYEGALAALRKAGAILVDVDVGHVEAYKEEHVPGEPLSLAVQSPWQCEACTPRLQSPACVGMLSSIAECWSMLQNASSRWCQHQHDINVNTM